jgi:hypothetical protein
MQQMALELEEQLAAEARHMSYELWLSQVIGMSPKG